MDKEERLKYFKFGFEEGVKFACSKLEARITELEKEDLAKHVNEYTDVKIS
jgi:hypothetical protein